MQYNCVKKVLIAAVLTAVLLCLPSVSDLSDADGAPHIGNVSYDPDGQLVLIEGSADTETVKGLIEGPQNKYYSFAFLVNEGKYSDKINIEGAAPGAYKVTIWNNAGQDTASFVIPDPADIKIVPDKSTAEVYLGESLTLTFSVSGCEPQYVKAATKNSDIVSIDSSTVIEGGISVTLTGLSLGTTTVSAAYGNTVTEVSVTVTEKPAEDRLYIFEIKMLVDADKVVSDKYTESVLKSGFTIQAIAKNAADALQNACDENGIPLELYSDGTLKGWIDSMFGLGDVNLGNGSWKYWIQYYEGSYNNYTLGYYTEGGTFQLVYGITKESDDAIYSETTKTDGTKEYSKTTQYKDSDGNKVVEVVGATENYDGTKIGSFESNTITSADGSVSSTTQVSCGSDGAVINAETVTTVTVSGGELDADTIQKALDQSKASVDKISVEAGNIEKVLKIENSDEIRIHMSSEALSKITAYGATITVEGSLGSSSGSLTVDSNICKNLSGGTVDLKVVEGKSTALTDKQKSTVGDRYFIILTATVDGKTVHQLGGEATVEFGYTLRNGENASDLCIYYVDGSGDLSRMEDSAYNTETGTFTMHTDHFSVFMVGAVPEDNDDGYLGLLVILAAAVILAVIVFGSAYYCEVVRLKKA